MRAEKSTDAASPDRIVWTCTRCGDGLIQDAPLMSAEQARASMHAAFTAGIPQAGAKFATIRWAMMFLLGGILGMLTWFMSQSALAACIVAGSVVLFLFVLGLMQRLYFVPRRVNRMVDEMLKQYPSDLSAS